VFSAGAASASVSTVGAGPTSVPADGATTSTITVTLLDANSNLVSGKTVTLAKSSGGTHSTITTVNGTTNASGQATFTVKDSTAESVTYQATDSTDSITVTQTAAVTFTASKLAFTTSAISVTAGVCSSVITVQTQDGSGNATDPPSTVTVALSSNSTGTYAFYSNSGCTTSITSASITTAANSASFYYKDTKAGGPVITAAATGGVTSSPTQTETVTAAAVSASTSSVNNSPASVPADGATTSTVTATLTDSFGNPVSGKTVTLTAGSGSSTITTVNGTSNSSGQATFTVKDTHAQTVVYTGKDTTDNITVTDTATVTFTASQLVWTTTQGNFIQTNTCEQYAVSSEDANGDIVDPPTTENIALTVTTGGGTFYSNSGCTTAITSTSIASSGSAATFYYKWNSTGNVTLQAAGSGAFTSTVTTSTFVF
jgi:hypothetical protein